MMLSGLTQVVITNSKKPFCIASTKGAYFFVVRETNEAIMKYFKVTVQYLNGVDFVYECTADTQWQAAAMARVQGRRMGFGGSMDVKNTITEEC